MRAPWAVAVVRRIIGYTIGFQVSKLAGDLKDPKIASLKEAAKLARVPTRHEAGHEASFNNLTGHIGDKTLDEWGRVYRS